MKSHNFTGGGEDTGRLVRMKENLEKAMKDLEEQEKLGMSYKHTSVHVHV